MEGVGIGLVFPEWMGVMIHDAYPGGLVEFERRFDKKAMYIARYGNQSLDAILAWPGSQIEYWFQVLTQMIKSENQANSK